MFQVFKTKRKMWICVGTGILLTALLVIAFGIMKDRKVVHTAAIPVKMFTVGQNSNDYETAYAGEINSAYETNLAFQASGKILYRRVKTGDHVKQGDIIAVLDTRDLEQSVRNTQAQESSMRSQLRLAEKNLQRYKKLFEDGAVSETVYDQYAQQYEAAAAAVEQSNAQYVQSANQLGYSMLVADRDGVVTKLKAEPGQVVAAGEAVAVIADEQNLEVEIDIPEKRMLDMAIGKTVSVKIGADANTLYNAIISEISPMADNETRTFKVKAKLQGDLSHVRLGMTAKVYMNNAGNEIIYVPLTAVFEQDGVGKGVWLICNGQISFKKIETGRLTKNQVEVVSGLVSGDVIVAAGVQKLHDGDLVGGIED